MDLIVRIFFESPMLLFTVLLLVEVAFAICWWLRPTRVSAGLAVGGLFVGAVLLIVQHLVVTDREQIRELIENLALAVDCEDIRPIEAAIDSEYNADGMDKAQLLRRMREAFEHADIDDVKLVDTRIQAEGDHAVVNLRAHARVRSPDWPYDYHLSAWDIELVRRGSAWRVMAARHKTDTSLTAKDLLDAVTR